MKLLSLFLFALCAARLAAADPSPLPKPTDSAKFEIGRDAFLLNGQPFVIRCGEVHAARVPREYWRHRLQMAKAMGLNTVCAYLFWNMHEPRPGQFDWSDRADVAEFCRLAQQEGLWVILRPGPYACAEWEMGGLPWWLLKHDDIKLRSRDPRFLDAARSYLHEVGRVLAPLQVTRGGPILMVQVENEYGFFGKDADYMGDMRQAVLDAGFDVPLFACNPTNQLRNGYRADLFPVVNFGNNPEGAFRELRKILPEGPLMSGEFYPGWFDTWGQPHNKRSPDRYLKDLETMLKMNASFSIYMAHGGTSFGFWPGADRPFKPDISSYDYDAPISEAGWVTDKFTKTRELFARYLQPGETLPEPPPAPPVITFASAQPTGFAPLLQNLPEPVRAEQPLNYEKLDQPFGAVLYRATLPAGPAATLQVEAAHDVGQVFFGGQRLGFLDRRNRIYEVPIPARNQPGALDILIETMGRVNFGGEVHDRKGLRGPVRLGGEVIKNWEMFSLPLDTAHLGRLVFNPAPSAGPGIHRFEVTLASAGDTFLDMNAWGKGMVWVNGHNLGRFWNIGPQQTLYVPGPWLKAGSNEILVLEYLDPAQPVLAGLAQPILDKLRPELDIIGRKPASSGSGIMKIDTPAAFYTGSFPAGGATQEVRFPTPQRARYFAIESLNAHDGKSFAAIADLSVLDANGAPLSTQLWTIASVTSQETVGENGAAGNAIDGQTSNYWHSQWKDKAPGHPHSLVLDLGRSENIGGFIYVPRQGSDQDSPGRIKDYQIFLGDKLVPSP